MKYLVMESATTYAVLLDEDGRFFISANMGYEVGDTVVDPVIMREQPLEKIKEAPKRMNRVIGVVVAIAAMVALFFGVNYYQQNLTPYSTILMAINPEIEMVLNRGGDVLEVNGTNADGQSLVENYQPSSKSKTEVANEIIDRAIEMGFLAEGGRVSIAIDTPDQALFEEYGIEMRRGLDGRISIEIEITDMENRNQRQEEPVEETPVPEEVPADDDSDYDDTDYEDSGYDESVYEEQAQEAAPAPAPTPKPATPAPAPVAPKAPAQQAPAPTTPASQPQQPAQTKDDDSDYDDTDYEDTDYDDSDYEDSDYDDSDYEDSDYD